MAAPAAAEAVMAEVAPAEAVPAEEVDTPGAPVRKERGKYKKDRDAPRKGAFLTQDEAVQAAAAEGLELQRSDNSTSGFRGVLLRPNIKSKPYLVKHWVGSSYKLLGAFPTGEEAALTFARAKRDAANASANAMASSSSYILGEDGQPIPSDFDPMPKRARKLTRPLHSWSTEDDQRLLQLCQGFSEKRTTSLKMDWEPVAEKMGGFCSASAMKLRWRMLAGKKVGVANGAIGQRAAGYADGSLLPLQAEGQRRVSDGISDDSLALRAEAVTITTLTAAERASAVEATVVTPSPKASAPATSASMQEQHDHMQLVPALESAQYLDAMAELPGEVPMEVPPAVEEECGGEEEYEGVVEAAAVEVGEEEEGEAVEAESVEVGMHTAGGAVHSFAGVNGQHDRHGFGMAAELSPPDGLAHGFGRAAELGMFGHRERGRGGEEEEEEGEDDEDDFMDHSVEMALREMTPSGDEAILS
jgi:hypothetical protein